MLATASLPRSMGALVHDAGVRRGTFHLIPVSIALAACGGGLDATGASPLPERVDTPTPNVAEVLDRIVLPADEPPTGTEQFRTFEQASIATQMVRDSGPKVQSRCSMAFWTR